MQNTTDGTEADESRGRRRREEDGYQRNAGVGTEVRSLTPLCPDQRDEEVGTVTRVLQWVKV